MLVFCYGCKDEARIPHHGLYYISTDNPVVDDEGVTFFATVNVNGTDPVEKRGFVVTRNYSYSSSRYDTIIEDHAIPLNGDFQLRLEGDWDSRISSSVYAYVKTKKYNHQGETIEFMPNGPSTPRIYSVTSSTGGIDGTFTIKGENFSKIRFRNKVYLAGEECTLLETSPTEIKVYYRARTFGYNDLTVSVGGVETTFQNALHLPGPKILSVSSNSIYTGKEITIMLEDFNKESRITVYVGKTVSEVLEKEDDYIRILCPSIKDGINTTISVYHHGRDLSTPAYNVSVPQNWMLMNTVSPYPGIQHIILDNEAYTISRTKELFKFNKKKCEWELLSQYDYNSQPITIFGRGEYIYIIMSEIIANKQGFSIAIYNLTTELWEKRESQIPGEIDQSALGIWINDDYYLTNRSSSTGNYMLVKYSPQTNVGTIVNEDLGKGYFKLLTAGDEVYAYFSNTGKLYKFDMEQQRVGELVYTLPSYCANATATVRHENDHIYLGLRRYVQSVWMFSFDIIGKKLRPLGSPEDDYSNLNFILPFQEVLYVGCSYYEDNYVYKYIGKE